MTPCLDLLRSRSAAGSSSQLLPPGAAAPVAEMPGQPLASRSFGPLRAGAASRGPYRRGSLPDLSDPRVRAAAMDDYTSGFYAASSAPSIAARRKLYQKIVLDWGFELADFGPELIHAVGATLRAGGYRSACNILSQLRVDAERSGIEVSAASQRALADAARSCRRGLGPPLRAMALDFARLEGLPGSSTPWAQGGPAAPRNALIISGWWLLREVEVANLRADCVAVTQGRCPSVALTLPASKADQAGVGVSRTHTCICGFGTVRPFCPAHAAWDQMILLQRWFPSHFRAGKVTTDLPFLPTPGGTPCSKDGVREDDCACRGVAGPTDGEQCEQ